MASTEFSDLGFKQEELDKMSQEVGETKAEPLEAPEVIKRVEQVTFDPEAVVQLEGDYTQAEAIQDAFVKVIETPILQAASRPPDSGGGELGTSDASSDEAEESLPGGDQPTSDLVPETEEPVDSDHGDGDHSQPTQDSGKNDGSPGDLSGDEGYVGDAGSSEAEELLPGEEEHPQETQDQLDDTVETTDNSTDEGSGSDTSSSGTEPSVPDPEQRNQETQDSGKNDGSPGDLPGDEGYIGDAGSSEAEELLSGEEEHLQETQDQPDDTLETTDNSIDEGSGSESGSSKVGLEAVGDKFVPLGESEPSILPGVSDRQESLLDTPLTLEQALSVKPTLEAEIPEASQGEVQDKSDAIPNTPVETVSQEIDPEVLQEIDLEPIIEEDPFVKVSEARAEAQDAAAEAESVGEALDTAEEEFEEAREAYEAELQELQDSIDALNEILAAENFAPVAMTIENGQIILSDNIISGTEWHDPDATSTPHPNPDGSDNTTDISHALEERLGSRLGLHFESHDTWEAAMYYRNLIYVQLASASLAQARMDDAQAKVEDLQAQYSAAVENAEAAEATAQLYELKIEKWIVTSEEAEEITDGIRMQNTLEQRQEIGEIGAEPLEATEVSRQVKQATSDSEAVEVEDDPSTDQLEDSQHDHGHGHGHGGGHAEAGGGDVPDSDHDAEATLIDHLEVTDGITPVITGVVINAHVNAMEAREEAAAAEARAQEAAASGDDTSEGGDSIQSLSHPEGGSWQDIAISNGIENPRENEPGEEVDLDDDR